MSEPETAAKPLLTPLIVGSRCTIDEAAARTIARWIVMKVLVGEHNIRGDAVATKIERESFRSQLAIPDNFKIWVGRCGIDGWQTTFWRNAATVSLSPDNRPEHKGKNTHSMTFGIGELLVYVIHTTVEGLDLTFKDIHRASMSALYPFAGPFGWPPARRLNGYEASLIAHCLDKMFRSKNVLWKPYPT
jgi:hypothetical protein